jgi:hypothetical protein
MVPAGRALEVAKPEALDDAMLMPCRALMIIGIHRWSDQKKLGLKKPARCLSWAAK